MEILRMNATYGRLEQQELCLHAGLNLICAPNESGKSTWTSFLRTMLYGLPSRDRGPLADKNRYAPWSGAAMQGRMDVLADGRACTLRRDTRRAASPMGDFSCTYTGTATPVEGITAQNAGEQLLGVPRDVFERSAFIGQNALAVEQSAELERRIAALITTGEEDASFSESYDRLKRQLNRRRSNRTTGQIPALERDIDGLRQSMLELDALHRQARQAQEEVSALEQRAAALRRQAAQQQALRQQERISAYRRAADSAEDAQRRADSLAGEAAALPEDAALALLEGQCAALADEMEQTVSGIRALMPIKVQTGTVRAGHTTGQAVFLGADERLGEVMQLEVLAGTLPNAWQSENAAPVAVVGDDLALTLYGRVNITGREIRLTLNGNDRYFTVCGVVRAQTGVLGGVLSAVAPHLVYVPYACLASPAENADQVFVQCLSSAASVASHIERYLTGQQVRGVRVQNMSGAVQTVQHLAEMGTGMFIAVGAVTLFVALIGVMGSMLAAAHEKTEEIGILLAIGAQPRDIRRIFLLQSVLLCAAGGSIGLLAAGLMLYRGAALFVPGGGVFLGLLALSVLCGAAAGLLPAVRAASLDPIDAMRK